MTSVKASHEYEYSKLLTHIKKVYELDVKQFKYFKIFTYDCDLA